MTPVPAQFSFSQARAPARLKGFRMLWTIFVVVLLLWILGFSFHVAGGLIHLLLVIALAILVFNLVTGRRQVL